MKRLKNVIALAVCFLTAALGVCSTGVKAESLGSPLENSTLQTMENEIIKNEEKIGNKLKEKNIKYLSVSKFMTSKKTQKENFELVKYNHLL